MIARIHFVFPLVECNLGGHHGLQLQILEVPCVLHFPIAIHMFNKKQKNTFPSWLQIWGSVC